MNELQLYHVHLLRSCRDLSWSAPSSRSSEPAVHPRGIPQLHTCFLASYSTGMPGFHSQHGTQPVLHHLPQAERNFGDGCEVGSLNPRQSLPQDTRTQVNTQNLDTDIPRSPGYSAIVNDSHLTSGGLALNTDAYLPAFQADEGHPLVVTPFNIRPVEWSTDECLRST